MRIRDRWPARENSVSIEENAGALAYVCWQVALDGTKQLHAQKFDYRDDAQRVAVISEYLVFLIHICDRICATQLQPGDREIFVIKLTRVCAGHLHRNAEEILGPGDYTEAFIDTFNVRSKDFSQCKYVNGGPGYSLLRAFGAQIQQLMGNSQTNRWVMD
ncbi:MAG: hypothetical protein VX559_12060, partial [Pseudomonadota bacterium]|nr:hypothetical protein [Pseudomonadota bacterium]